MTKEKQNISEIIITNHKDLLRAERDGLKHYRVCVDYTDWSSGGISDGWGGVRIPSDVQHGDVPHIDYTVE